MRRQMQGIDECLLTSVCNVLDIDLQLARSLIPEEMPWRELLRRDLARSYRILEEIAKRDFCLFVWGDCRSVHSFGGVHPVPYECPLLELLDRTV